MWVDQSALEAVNRMKENGLECDIFASDLIYPKFDEPDSLEAKLPAEIKKIFPNLTWGEKYLSLYFFSRSCKS